VGSYWLTFYLLLQQTLDAPDNCWFAEIDFLEGPGWCGVNDYTAAQSVFSTGAQYGSASCMAQRGSPGREFGSQCTTPQCCEGTNCGAGAQPFSTPSAWPANASATPGTLGCTTSPAAGEITYGPTDSADVCGDFAGLGGDGTNSFFELDPAQEYLFAFVVDKTGTWAYRWPANDETSAAAVWPGLRKCATARAGLLEAPV
jgi:hypothetical protein